MNDGARLLRAVLDDPADDTVRLIYADWLEECGGQPERAEFIRVQVELAGVPECERPHGQASPCRRFYGDGQRRWCAACCAFEAAEPLRRRQGKLFEARGPEGVPSWKLWEWPVRSLFEGQMRALFRRGFVAAVELKLAAWLACGPRMVRAAPLEALCLTDCNAAPVGPGRWRVTPARKPKCPFRDTATRPTAEAAELAFCALALKWARQAGAPTSSGGAAAHQ